MPSSQRVTQTEYQRRMDILLALRARGLAPSHLIKIACQEWKISERQAKRYLQKARQQETVLASQTLAERYTTLLNRLNYIYQQAIQLRDLELARRTASDLLQVFQQQRKDLLHDSAIQPTARLVEADELEALIRSLEEDGSIEPA